MKLRSLVLSLLVAATAVAPALAADGPMGGLGFRYGGSPFAPLLGQFFPEVPQSAPFVGGRHWFNGTAGFDLGLGFNSYDEDAGSLQRTYTGYAVDAGIPISLKRWDKVNFILRPGAQFGSIKEEDKSAPPTVTTTLTMYGVSADFEVEWMVADRLSLSASHGIGWHMAKDDATPESKFTALGTQGSNFTQLGFHVYLW